MTVVSTTEPSILSSTLQSITEIFLPQPVIPIAVSGAPLTKCYSEQSSFQFFLGFLADLGSTITLICDKYGGLEAGDGGVELPAEQTLSYNDGR